ncbi:SMR family transporter [Rhodopseudomonas pseudopalustris]|jgi:small multidrug resistance pump|uniref:Small multidrug resistance pump n=1 Tax=Rhodopseudomonas faecalis TaxID=99655 RepID=A0A318TNI9_9BRAD|nr:SMR family transporter [Rhodopseudomonas faecalis]PYF00193.1 small multidrug resistance pump [Rhodopseudomonas faecalis]TAH67916.1 MAG: QacE family quaternary ammonium compound efflux SMR transporter [Rhodopseudomonas palustris]
MTYVFLLIAIIAEVIGTTFLKLSDGFTKLGPTLVTVVGYGVSFYFLSLTLRTLPTGIAYAIWSGVGVVLIAGAAWAFMGQKLDIAALCGIAMIIGGVIVINLFSNAAGH